MLLLAFPASEGSLCCLGSGDWPLDPHEILLHPQDLEKLRVPAFGYVAIHRNTSSRSSNSSTGRGSGCRRPRSEIGRGRESAHGSPPRPAGGDENEEPITFCRAVPDDALSPGETRAPAWLLAAANVRPRQHLLVRRVPEVAGGGGASASGAPAGGRQHGPVGFRVGLSLASERRLGETGQKGCHAASGASVTSRAIARRVSGCMVGLGSLLAAEVLGETVVLQVVELSERLIDNDNDSGSNGSNGSTNNNKTTTINTTNSETAVDASVPPLPKHFVVTSPSQVALVEANVPGERSSSCLPRSGVAASPASPRGEQMRHRRPSARRGGLGEVCARRAPGLEAVLTELQDLVLLSVGAGAGAGAGGRSLCSGPRSYWKDVLPAGLVVCGPSGIGKTLALDILTEDLRETHSVHVIRLLGPQILAGVGQRGGGSGGGAGGDGGAAGDKAASPLLQGPLGLSLAEARDRAPSVIVLDELDALFDACGGSGDEGGGWGGADPLGEGVRANAALLEMLDRASVTEGVTVLGATRRSPGGKGGAGWMGLETGGGSGVGGGDGAALPAAFRKPGRFDRCVTVAPPTQAQREIILRVILSSHAGGGLGWQLEPLGIAPSAESPADEATPGGVVEPEESSTPVAVTQGSRRSGTPDEGARGSRGDGRRSDRESPKRAEHERRTGHKIKTREAGAAEAGGALAEWAERLSSVTPGMVGGDLERLVRTARARSAQRRRSSEGRGALPPNTLHWQDAMAAVAATVPRSLRGLDVASSGSGGGGGGEGRGGGSAPTWASVGGFSEAKHRLQRLVQWPWLHPEAFARMGVSAPAGALLYGPSGCGKSLVAQVLATECLANFLWVRSSELLSRYLGETEAKLRALFSRARAAAPCILFLDELDAITAKRGDGGGEGSGGAGSVHARVLSTLLNEMDGVATTSGPAPASASSSSGGGPAAGAGGGVLVLAATNRRDALDAALLRPGRLHESVELGVPGREDREGVLRVHAGRLPLDAGVDLARLSQDDVSGGLTCADLEASCRDAAMMAVREDLHGAREVRPEHLRKALEDRVAGRLRTGRFTFSIGQGPSGAA